MNCRKSLVLLVFAMLMASTAVAQVEYHVSRNGDDNNPGTVAQPFRTLGKPLDLATTLLQGQVTVLVAAGEYDVAGVDLAAVYSRPGIGQNTYLRIEGGYNEVFNARPGESVFSPSGIGMFDSALSVNLAARQRLEVSQFVIRGTGGTGLTVTCNLGGMGMAEQSDARVDILDSEFTGNLNGAVIDLQVGPGGFATTALNMHRCKILDNASRGLIVSRLTDMAITDTLIKGNGNPSGTGLIISSTRLRNGVIDNTEISGNHVGMELVNIGTEAFVSTTGLLLVRTKLVDNAEDSIIETVSLLTLELGTIGSNPVTITDRRISTWGSLNLENLRIVQTGNFTDPQRLVFDKVRGSGFIYSMVDAKTRVEMELDLRLSSLGTGIVLQGSTEADRIRAYGGSSQTATVDFLDPGNPLTVLSRVRIIADGISLSDVFPNSVSINARAGHDRVELEASRLSLFVFGDSGDDILEYTDDESIPLGEVGRIYLSGSIGNDTLTATTGVGRNHVILEGGPGNDTVTGGFGNELFIWRQDSGPIAGFTGGGGVDTLRCIFHNHPGFPLLLERDSVSGFDMDVAVPVGPRIQFANGFSHLEVITDTVTIPIEVYGLSPFLRTLTVSSAFPRLEAKLGYFSPHIFGPDGPQFIRFVGPPQFSGEEAVLDIRALQFNETIFRSLPGGLAMPSLIELQLVGSLQVLPILLVDLDEVRMHGSSLDDTFVTHFLPGIDQRIFGGPGNDTLTVPALEEPYSASIEGEFKRLFRNSSFGYIRYKEIEVENINPSSTSLPGDATGDGVVNVADITMIANYIFRGGPMTDYNNADVNGDGVVGTDDIDLIVDMILN